MFVTCMQIGATLPVLYGSTYMRVPGCRQGCERGWRRGGRGGRRWRPGCCRASWTPRRCPTGAATRHWRRPCDSQHSHPLRRHLTLPPSPQLCWHDVPAPGVCRRAPRQSRQPPAGSFVAGHQECSQNPCLLSADTLSRIPIGSSYVAEPRTPLHAIDARVKEAWVVALLLLVARASGRTGVAIAAGAPLPQPSRPRPAAYIHLLLTWHCALDTMRTWQGVSAQAWRRNSMWPRLQYERSGAAAWAEKNEHRRPWSLTSSLRGGAGVALLTVATQPRRLWRAQLPRLAALAAFLFLATAIGSDGVPPVTQPRIAAAAQVLSRPAAEITSATLQSL